MKKTINLNKIKVAIFDFDDTLAIHTDKNYLKHRNESEEKLLEYFLNAYLNPKSFYEEIECCDKSDIILELIKKLRKQNIKLYCVTGMRFSLHFKAKEYFVNKYYGDDIEVISTKDHPTKLEATQIISMINNCKLNEILFVDDMKENILMLNNFGVNAILPSDIQLL